MNDRTIMKRAQAKLDELRAEGLSDLKLTGDFENATADDIAEEFIRMTEAIQRGDFKPLNLDDSYRDNLSFEEWWGTTCASAARNKTKCRLKETAYAAWNHQQAIIDEKDKKIVQLEKVLNKDTKNSDTMSFNIKILWDREAQVWCGFSEDWLGISLEDENVIILIDKLKSAIPEMATLNKSKAPFISDEIKSIRSDLSGKMDTLMTNVTAEYVNTRLWIMGSVVALALTIIGLSARVLFVI